MKSIFWNLILYSILVINGNIALSQDVYRGQLSVDGSKLDYVIEGRGKACLVIGSSVYYPKTFSPELQKHLKI